MKTRYFVRRDSNGELAGVYKSEWALGQLTAEFYWDFGTSEWNKDTKDIFSWNHFGDTELEEVTEQAALALI